MVRFVCTLAALLVFASFAQAQQAFVGTYKIVSQVHELRGVASETVTESRHGYLVFTPKRAVAFYAADKGRFSTSVAERAEAFEGLSGWAGLYRVEGNRLVISVDTSLVETWNGKDRACTWELSGNRLTLTSDPMLYVADPSKTIVVRQVWEKVE